MAKFILCILSQLVLVDKIIIFALITSNSIALLAETKLVPKKIVILYSSFGSGNLNAANLIEVSIKEKDPTVITIKKDILEFSKQKAKNQFLSNLLGSRFAFDKLMEEGRQLNDFALMPSSLDKQAFRNWINLEGPTSIVATHFGGAELLSSLRAEGLLKTTSISWLHTDYFTGYLPRVASSLDRTFVGSNFLRQSFTSSGADNSKIFTSGIPLNSEAFLDFDKNKFLVSEGLNANLRTILISTNQSGEGEFSKIIKSIYEQFSDSIQIVAVCGSSQKNLKDLLELKSKFGDKLNLKILGLIPNSELMKYIKISDYYITKSGGFSASEAFIIGKPTILLNHNAGYENENASNFEKEKLAIVNNSIDDIGVQLKELSDNNELLEEMRLAQTAFRNSYNIDQISEFALKPKKNNHLDRLFVLGIEGGVKAEGTVEMISKLDKISPSDVEIVLSYPQSFTGKYIDGPGSNPFGHLAVRVEDKLYTANHIARPETESELMYTTSLDNYLYGIDRENINAEHTSSFGLSYGRDSISLRVSGLPQEKVQAMHKEAQKINQDYLAGKVSWIGKKSNCANFVAQILIAGGLSPKDLEKSLGKRIAMPLDVFDAYLQSIQSDTSLRSELVSYTRVANSQNMYKTARFPLSIYKIKRSLVNYFSKGTDEIEKRVSKRVTFYPGSINAHLEDLNSELSYFKREGSSNSVLDLNELVRTEMDLEKSYEKLKSQNLNYVHLEKILMEDLAKLNDETKLAIFSGKIGSMPDSIEKAKANILLKKIKELDSIQQTYQNDYDNLVKSELDYFLREIYITVEDYHLRMVKGRSDKTASRLNAKFNEIKEDYVKYLGFRKNYGGPKDGPTRTSVTRIFFDHSKEYFDIVENRKGPSEYMESGLLKKLKVKAKYFGSIVRILFKMIPQFTKVIFNVYAKPISPAGTSPVSENIHKTLANLSDELGIQIEVLNKEKIPKVTSLGEDKIVNIITPTHRDSTLDAFVMSKLGLEKALLVMAPDQFLPKILANKVDKVDSIIGVGRGANLPILKISEQLARSKSNTIILYPEGSINAGLEELRPPREKFSYGLIKKLISEGYKVNIIPITYHGTAKFAHEGRNANPLQYLDKNVRLKAIVHNPINYEVVEMMMNNFDPQSVARMIRGRWIEELGISNISTHGLVKVKEAIKRLNNLGIPVKSETKKVPMYCLKFYGA